MMSSRACRRRATAWLCLLLLGVGMAAAAALQPSRGIAVLYPEIGEPYRSVFARIIDGVEEQTRSRVPSFAVGASPNLPEIAGELRRLDIRVVIALGRNGLKFTSGLERDIGVVAGGVLSIPEADAHNISVLSLAPDPGLLFSLYPDNVEIGRHLATSALGYIASNGQGPRGVLPLKAVLLAVNVRTAGHLGINLSGRQSFDLVFPEQ